MKLVMDQHCEEMLEFYTMTTQLAEEQRPETRPLIHHMFKLAASQPLKGLLVCDLIDATCAQEPKQDQQAIHLKKGKGGEH